MYFCKIADPDSTLGCSLSFVQGNSLHPYGYSIYICIYDLQENGEEEGVSSRLPAGCLFNV